VGTAEIKSRLNDLKEVIPQEIANLSPAMLGKVSDDFSARLEECITQDEHNLKDFAFKS
jgi:hypothetical protein